MSIGCDAKIFVAGHRGLAGSALLRRLHASGRGNLLLRTHPQLDLVDQAAVRAFFAAERPAYVLLAAAKVGGIEANSACPGDFIYRNLAIQNNVLHEAWRAGVRRLLFLCSSCIYPRDCAQPMREESLLTGPLEPTNRAYAVAKIAGIEICRSYNQQYGTRFLAAMPASLFGPGDNYDPQTSHVLAALIRKAHEAKVKGERSIVVWGTGSPLREFLYSDEAADGCLFLMDLPEEQFASLVAPGAIPLINVGAGREISIRDLARMVASAVGFAGEIVFDASKPDGMPRKLMDGSRLAALGWQTRIGLREGIALAYAAFLNETA